MEDAQPEMTPDDSFPTVADLITVEEAATYLSDVLESTISKDSLIRKCFDSNVSLYLNLLASTPAVWLSPLIEESDEKGEGVLTPAIKVTSLENVKQSYRAFCPTSYQFRLIELDGVPHFAMGTIDRQINGVVRLHLTGNALYSIKYKYSTDGNPEPSLAYGLYVQDAYRQNYMLAEPISDEEFEKKWRKAIDDFRFEESLQEPREVTDIEEEIVDDNGEVVPDEFLYLHPVKEEFLSIKEAANGQGFIPAQNQPPESELLLDKMEVRAAYNLVANQQSPSKQEQVYLAVMEERDKNPNMGMEEIYKKVQESRFPELSPNTVKKYYNDYKKKFVIV